MPADTVASPSPKPPSAPEVFPSAVDRWLIILLALPIVVATGTGLFLLADGRPGDASLFFLMAATILMVTSVFTVPCRYTLLDDAVSIRCGLICYQVPYDRISGVRKSQTWASGPALSLRRVAIETERRNYILSPSDRDRFLEQLKSRSGC